MNRYGFVLVLPGICFVARLEQLCYKETMIGIESHACCPTVKPRTCKTSLDINERSDT